MGNGKITFFGETLIDLTGDNISADKVLKGFQGHGPDGEPFEGTCEFDVNSQEATATEAETLMGKTFGARGQIRTGTMPNNGAVSGTIVQKDGKYTIPQGYHDGTGVVELDATEKAKLVADNIREGVTIFGVEGRMSGTEDAKPQSKEVTPGKTAQTVLPDEGYNYLSQVVVKGVPYTVSDNAAGGKTITIG